MFSTLGLKGPNEPCSRQTFPDPLFQELLLASLAALLEVEGKEPTPVKWAQEGIGGKEVKSNLEPPFGTRKIPENPSVSLKNSQQQSALKIFFAPTPLRIL